MNSKTHIFDIGQTFETRHGTMVLVDRFDTYNDVGKHYRKYTIRCPKGHEYTVDEYYLKAGRLKTCKLCNHPPIINSDPEFAKWFVDPTIPETRSHSVHDKADFYCQNCGRIVKDLAINNIYKRRYIPCPYCSPNITYPERYVSALLTQLNATYKRQYCVRPSNNYADIRYLYDFYDPQKKLIIETHGQQHFVHSNFERLSGITLEQTVKRDQDKERYATDILGLSYVFLDCRYSEASWIRAEAIEKLSAFYSLECVDWIQVEKDSHNSDTIRIIELRKQGYDFSEISEIVHLEISNVYLKLNRAFKSGLCDKSVLPLKKTADHTKAKEKPLKKPRVEKKKAINIYAQRFDSEYLLDLDVRNAGTEIILREMRIRNMSYASLDKYARLTSSVRFVCGRCGAVFLRTPQNF